MARFSTITLSKPIPPNLREAINAVLMAGQNAMPWSNGMQGEAALIMNNGSWPVPLIETDFLSDPLQQAQWRKFRTAYQPTTAAVLRGEMDAAASASAAAAANVAFWDDVYRTTLAVATLGLSEAWAKLTATLNQYRSSRAATLASIQTIEQTLNDPAYAATHAQAQNYVAQLRSKLADNDNGVRGALGPLASKDEVKQEAGLGFPAWLGAVGAGVVLAIVAALGLWITRAYDLQEQANSNAQEILRMRQTVIDSLATTGKITPEQYQNANNQNSNLAVMQSTAQGKASMGLGTGSLVAIGVGALALIGGLIWLRKRRA